MFGVAVAAARAMLYRAEIMLLDEPTNHLDVKNVAWLVNYLTTLTDVTSVIVSHDSTFLDNVCQSIIHYENRKLKIYKVSALSAPTCTASLDHARCWKLYMNSVKSVRASL